MKKTLPLLLALCMILSLCACGEAPSAPAETAVPAPETGDSGSSAPEEAPASAEESPEPEYYNLVVKDAVTRKTVRHGQTAPTLSEPALGLKLDSVTEYFYDGSAEPAEKTTWLTGDEYLFSFHVVVPGDLKNSSEIEAGSVQIEYDASGEPVRGSGPYVGNEMILAVSELENGHVVKSTLAFDPAVSGMDDLVRTCQFSYDGEGRLLSEEVLFYYDIFFFRPFPSPYYDLYEYDGNGNLTHWETRNGDTDSGADIRYEYDASGELIRMSIVRNGGEPETLEISRDGEGRVTGSVQTGADGTVLTHSYSYDEQGRILSDDVSGGKNDLSFRLEYDGEGYPLSMSRYVDGTLSKTTAYTLTDKGYAMDLSGKPAFEEADILCGQSSFRFYERERSVDGQLLESRQYELAVA